LRTKLTWCALLVSSSAVVFCYWSFDPTPRLVMPISDRPPNLVFSHDGRFLASVSIRLKSNWAATRTVAVWDLCEGQHIFSLPAEEIFWRDDLGDSVGFSRDSRTLAILGFDSVGLWEVPTGKKLESATARYTWRERRCLATDKAGNLL